MALRSMIRKVPALAAGLRAPSSALRPWSRFLSKGTGAAAGRQAVHSEEMLREEADRVHAKFLREMKLIQQERDELWRLEDENRAKFHKQLDTVEMGCNVIGLLCVSTIVILLMNM